MKSTNRKVAMVAETNAEFFLNQTLIFLRVFLRELCISALRSINIPSIIFLARGPMIPLDIEYCTWANPRSEVVYFAAGGGCCG
jgi:hypothetical protein